MALIVNNNPYKFEFYLYLNFKKRTAQFEAWLARNYPDKARRCNLFIGDLLGAMATRGYNLIGIGFDNLVDLFLKAEADGYLFLFPERKLMNERFKSVDTPEFQVFLSHSGQDRPLVDLVFDELQRAEVGAWYDKYEIQAGDSITERINEGLAQCDLGILFLSKSFLDPRSGWTKAEMNYFFHDRMKSRKKSFSCVNVDLAREEIPRLLRDYRYISWEDPSAPKQIVDAVRRSSNDHNV